MAVLVQEQNVLNFATSTLASIAFAGPVSSGNSVIAVFMQTGGTTSTTSNPITVSDTANGSYGTRVEDRESGGNKRVAIFAKHAISSGGFTAISFQASTSIAGRVSLYEVSGLSGAAVSGSNDNGVGNSSVFALSSAQLSQTGFAVGALVCGNNWSSVNTLEAGYTVPVTTNAFMFSVRNSSGSHVFANTQCTGTIAGNVSRGSALAIFADAGSAAVGIRPGLRMFYGVGR